VSVGQPACAWSYSSPRAPGLSTTRETPPSAGSEWFTRDGYFIVFGVRLDSARTGAAGCTILFLGNVYRREMQIQYYCRTSRTIPRMHLGKGGGTLPWCICGPQLRLAGSDNKKMYRITAVPYRTHQSGAFTFYGRGGLHCPTSLMFSLCSSASSLCSHCHFHSQYLSRYHLAP
jgi:hypothetical protein